jgi:hypothetical protein
MLRPRNQDWTDLRISRKHLLYHWSKNWGGKGGVVVAADGAVPWQNVAIILRIHWLMQ